MPELVMQVGLEFLYGLDDPVANKDMLSSLVTPESLPAWGDFHAVSEALSQIPDWGYASIATRPPTDHDVAYIKVLRDVQEADRAGEHVTVAAVLTLVWRPDHGRWMVHTFGLPAPAVYVPHGTSYRDQ